MSIISDALASLHNICSNFVRLNLFRLEHNTAGISRVEIFILVPIPVEFPCENGKREFQFLMETTTVNTD